MNAPRDLDSIVTAWLEEGPTVLPDQTRRAITVNSRTIRQTRHPRWVPWRTLEMNPLARMAVIAIALVVVVGGAVYFLSPAGNSPGPGVGGLPATTAPSPLPSPSRSVAPPTSPLPSSGAAGPLDTSSWTPYTSSRYRFSIGHPVDWSDIPSDRTWAFPADATCCPPPGTETFLSAPGDVGVSAWSVGIAKGQSLDAWIQAYCQVMEPDSPCTALQGGTVPATLDGHAGRLIEFKSDTQAFFLVGDKVYVVACWRPESDGSVAPYGGARRLLEGYLSTMRLPPGGSASTAPSRTPGPS